jgi:hypothetical protein
MPGVRYFVRLAFGYDALMLRTEIGTGRPESGRVEKIEHNNYQI